MQMTTISNSQDVIDSRDVIARIEELQDERDDLESNLTEAKETREAAVTNPPEEPTELSHLQDALEAAEEALKDWDEDNKAELDALLALQEEAEGCADWKYGETLIRDSYFVRYAQELADDIGAINKDASWPNDCIDWDRAARELQMDYTSVNFDGVEYWIRS